VKRTAFSRSNVITGVLLVAVIIGGIVFQSNSKPAAAKPANTQQKTAAAQSAFSFDAAAAPGWRQGPSNATSMALFSNTSDCFVSFSANPGAPNEAAELQKLTAGLESSGYTVTSLGTPELTLKQPDSETKYTLHQYSVIGAGTSDDVYKSQAHAYIKVATGYIQAQGYCADPANLPTTAAALQAVTYKP
jgi:hypothetical protein